MRLFGRGKERIRRSTGERILIIIVFVLFAVYAVSLLFPFGWCFINSFKGRKEFNFNIWGFAKTPVWSNWVDCFNLTYNDVNIFGMFFNSAVYMIGCTFVSMFFCCCTAYTIAKYRFRGRNFLYTLAYVLMIIPTVGSTAAIYKLYNQLNFYDTYYGIILTSCGGFGMSFVYLYGFFKNLSWSYAEAALVDGAGHFRIYFSIMIPMAIPAVTAVAVLQMIGIWNDYFTIYMYAPSKVTIALGLKGLVDSNSYGKISYPQIFAVMLVSIVPVVAVYAGAQKLIVNNTSVGGLKG